MIKAIRTQYKGYSFRSRLEARWAVFFDAIGIQYQYEPEGFDLGDLGWYLPDFYLPEVDAWIEIKPNNSPINSVFNQLIQMMQIGITENAWGLFGDPLDHKWLCPVFYLERGWVDEFPKAGIEFNKDEEDKWYVSAGFCLSSLPPEDFFKSRKEEFITNYKERCISRSARFEHGEAPC